LTSVDEIGGLTCSILSYNLEYSLEPGIWVEMTGVSELYLGSELIFSENIQSGLYYQVRIRSKNKHGWSEFSNELTIISATEPLEPQTTKSRQESLFSVLEWTMDNDHGAPILEYEVKIQAASSDMLATPTCDGTEAEVITSRTCKISYEELRYDPYLLSLGDPVIFIVRARNVIGWSPYSLILA
jgi:hypothetical protein